MSRPDEICSADVGHHPVAGNEVQIDYLSGAAISEEIGDRLRISLKGKPGRLPDHVMRLVEQLAQIDSFPTKSRSQSG
jgi:hypothetical protein